MLSRAVMLQNDSINISSLANPYPYDCCNIDLYSSLKPGTHESLKTCRWKCAELKMAANTRPNAIVSGPVLEIMR